MFQTKAMGIHHKGILISKFLVTVTIAISSPNLFILHTIFLINFKSLKIVF